MYCLAKLDIWGSWCQIWISLSVSCLRLAPGTEINLIFEGFPYSFDRSHIRAVTKPWKHLNASPVQVVLDPSGSMARCTIVHEYNVSIRKPLVSWRKKRVSNTFMHWSLFIVAVTMYSRPVLWTETPPQTMTLSGCFTCGRRQSGKFCSLLLLRTYWALSRSVSIVDSSENST